MSDTLSPHGLRHTRLPCPSLSSGVCSDSCLLSQWCHPTSHPLSSSSPPAFSLSQHQGLFQWIRFLQQVAEQRRVIWLFIYWRRRQQRTNLISCKSPWWWCVEKDGLDRARCLPEHPKSSFNGQTCFTFCCCCWLIGKPWAFCVKLNPSVSDSFTLNLSRCYFAKMSWIAKCLSEPFP